MTLGKIGSTDIMHNGLTAIDYIQDGLIAMWDGVENAGWRTHDSSYVGLRNLTGKGCDLDMMTNGYIAENCVKALESNNSVCSLASTDSCSKLVTSYLNVSKAYTFEIVGSGFGVRGNVEQALTGGTPSGGVAGGVFDIYTNSGYGYGSILVRSRYLFTPSGWITNGSLGTGFASHSRSADKTSYRTYINAVQKQSSDSVGADFRYTTLTYTRYMRVRVGTGDKIFCVRLYDRMLSAAEIAANHDIDVARFNPNGGGGA